jgi:hypothetical protein
MLRISILAFVVAAASLTTGAVELLDRSFGSGGTWPVPSSVGDLTGDVKDGRAGSLLVVVDGVGPSRLVRLSQAGQPVMTFGSQGSIPVAQPTLRVQYANRTDVTETTMPLRGILGEDGNGILMQWGAGGRHDPANDGSHLLLLLARFTSEGQADPTFGTAGVVKIRSPAGNDGDACRGLAIIERALPDGDGTLLFGRRRDATYSYDGYGLSTLVRSWDCAIGLRLDAQGRLDPAFGVNGVFQHALLGKASIDDAYRNPDASLTLVGRTRAGETDPGRAFHWALMPGGVPATAEPTYFDLPPIDPRMAGSRSVGIRHYPRQGWIRYSNNLNVEYLQVIDQQGRAETAFGPAGVITLPHDERSFQHFGRTAEGGVYALGTDTASEAGWRFLRMLFCRWLSNGEPDPSVGAGGCARVATPMVQAKPVSAYPLADGSVVVQSSNELFGRSTSALKGTLLRLHAAPGIVEFHNTTLDHYFYAYDGAEARGIDAGAAGAGWVRTGQRFASGGTRPTCRFYSFPFNTHFFTADPAECAAVKNEPRWTYEAEGFHSTPVGECAPNLRLVHRLFSNRANDHNHRFVTDLALSPPMIARGWIQEGVAFCVRP